LLLENDFEWAKAEIFFVKM